MKLRTLIVDDEPLGRERLRMHLENNPHVELVGECSDGREAVSAITSVRPDLVLLDVQMPELDGFDVVSALTEDELPIIIFVTAFDEYAIRAFDINAVDYVLKPVDPTRLALAIERALAQMQLRDRAELQEKLHRLVQSMQTRRPHLQRLVVREKGVAFFLPVGEIDWIEAAGNYVRIHTAGRPYLLRQTLRDIEQQLDPESFARVHRSGIVNIASVKRIEPWVRGEYRIVLRDGTALTSSRAYGQAFRALLE